VKFNDKETVEEQSTTGCQSEKQPITAEYVYNWGYYLARENGDNNA